MLSTPHATLQAFADALSEANVATEEMVCDDNGTYFGAPARLPTGLPALTRLAGEGALEIVVKRELSRGGMGQILLAEQRSLARDVAVKVATGTGDSVEAELVVEARIAAHLEHPNIVPIHILGTSADGKPLIVMKRIEGESWATLLAAGRDLLRDIPILMDVCRALHFAHSRGVIHRDLKPANAMVGRFGEVYLLDWGIAAAFGDEAPVDLRARANAAPRIVGTPAYMAPEMVFPQTPADPRTDVYLVGAVLHELITGVPPREGGDLRSLLYAAHKAEAPTFHASVDEELAAICAKAMQRSPDDRFQTVDALRAALAGFLGHAAARELGRAADEKLVELTALPRGADSSEALRVFTECRFGFSQALRAWPGNRRARDGFTRAVVEMARREVELHRYDSARLLAAELDVVPADLARQLEDLKRERAAEATSVESLRRLTHEQDLSIAGRERAILIFGCGLVWLLALIGLHVLARREIFVAKSGTFAVAVGSFVAVVAAVGAFVPSVRDTAASRAHFLALLWSLAGITAVHFAGWWFDIAPAPMLAAGHSLLATALLSLAAHDARVRRGAILAAISVVVIFVFAAAPYLASGVSLFVALSVFALDLRKAPSATQR